MATLNFKKHLFAAAAFFATSLSAHDVRTIDFPDFEGYVTLSADLHQHTVFSDGHVWPTIRVREGLHESIDVIAITDHLEYQPHAEDIPHPDRNRSHDIAMEEGEDEEIIIVQGAEITRDMPPGHMNAVFIEDANLLIQDDPVEVTREAVRQGGFVFWNHPAWWRHAPDGVARLTDMHQLLIKDGLLRGIEVVNEHTYSEEALQIALDHNLTILGTSDIHGLVDWEFELNNGGHRPVTLVFASERSPAAVKEALLDRRTVVWYKDALIGREAWLQKLLDACLTIGASEYRRSSSILETEIHNSSSAVMHLRAQGPYAVDDNVGMVVVVPPHGSASVSMRILERRSPVELVFEVVNAITTPGEHPAVKLVVEAETALPEED